MRTVQHAQLAQLMRPHVLDKLHIRPIGAGSGKTIFNHPFPKCLGGHRHRVFALLADRICGCRGDPVNHGVGKPCQAPINTQMRGLRKLLDGLTQGVAIAWAVVTAQDGDGAISLGKVMSDEPDEAAQRWTGKLCLDHRVLQVELAILIQMVALFGDGCRDNIGMRHGL